MGIFSSKVEYKFFEEYQKQLCQLDNSLTSLASLVDSTHESVQLLLQQLEQTEPGEGSEGISSHSSNIKLTRKLLSSVETGLYHEKMAFLQGISQFLHLLREKSDNRQYNAKYLSTMDRLNIDKYIAEFQKKDKSTFNPEKIQQTTTGTMTSSVDLDSNRSPEAMERVIEQLQKEIESLKQSKVKPKTNDDYVTYNNRQKKEAGSYALQISTMSAQIKSLKEENEKLKNDLEKALRRVETVPVQIYRQRRGELMSLIEQELLAKLDAYLDSENKELEATRCEKTTDIQPDKPLLVLCISTSRLGTDVKSAIQGVLQLEHTVLLIFHHKDVHALPSQSSDRVLAGPEFKALKHIFDMAFLTGKGMYECEMNNHAVAGTVEFIYKVSEETGLVRK